LLIGIPEINFFEAPHWPTNYLHTKFDMERHLFFGWICLILLAGFAPAKNQPFDEHPTLPIGSPAPPFNLQGVDGKMYSLSSFSEARILVIIFTCNHCPTAQSYEDRIIKLTSDYRKKGVAVVAIMPNDPKSLRLDEMDFSDLGDSFEDMKVRASDKNFNFPYLYDGETETVSKAYGPIATPHVFVFDASRKLRYNGRFDDMESHDKPPRVNNTRDAIDSLLDNRPIAVPVTKVFGCSVKWSDKRSSVQQSLDNWAMEPVSADTISSAGLQALFRNESDKLRLIFIWSNSSMASQREFPDLVAMNRMYRDRDFEFISIHIDPGGDQKLVMSFLQKQQASNKNYLYPGADLPGLLKVTESGTSPVLPYTALVEPGGKRAFEKLGYVDPAQLKKQIVNNHLIGRYP